MTIEYLNIYIIKKPIFNMFIIYERNKFRILLQIHDIQVQIEQRVL